MVIMTGRKPLYKLCPVDTFSFIPVSIATAVFGGVTIWLYLKDNGIMFFTGALTALMILIIIYSVYCCIFVKLNVFEDGFYYKKGFAQGKFYKYSEITEAAENQKHNPNGSVNYCFSFTASDGTKYDFICPMSQSDGIDYMIDIIDNQ